MDTSRRPSERGEATQRELDGRASEPPRKHDMEHFEAAGRRISVCLAHRNYERAREALEAEIGNLEAQDKKPPFWNTSLADIGVDYRVCAAMEEHLEVLTIGDLMQRRTEEILAVKGMGVTYLVGMMQRVVAHAIRYIPD